ncbi:dephospho-CoA kinase [Cohaesibacter sp. ES.047]|uniref:dephospho-CoA kinase n=1 Tax=Cohaesibacter sp. ES.047 TaxID=1798205 RepID=UPI000BB7CA61|nr:dephospho-CoA kinase [Cohaesibacter sp. ES.047]SNY90515.1 dephospho-CoA kinase [Cohaesibacter sp. ES.047]
MIRLGLTGSIGMGKSTVGAMFEAHGCPLHDADAAVHALYRSAAVPLIEAEFPGTTGPDGVDRAKLSKHVIGKPEAMKRLEAIIHPLVRDRELAFYQRAEDAGADMVLIDIPLLFETGAEDRFDAVVVVSAPEDVQRARVLAREGMTEEKFEAIKAKQIPDADKRQKADYVVDTGLPLEETRAQVDEILDQIKSRFAQTRE